MAKYLFNRIDDLKNEIDSFRPFNDELLRVLQEKLRIEWTYNSNAIEGSTLTLGETAFFLKEGLTSEGKPLIEYLEAKNHAEAIDLLNDIIKDKRKITESLIKEMHGLLLRGVEFTVAKGSDGSLIKKPLNPGKYKERPNHVLTLSGKIHRYTSPIHVKDEMEKLVKWLNGTQDIHIIEKVSIFHYRFASIHPFDDGNGRMARLLMNLILMRQKYFPCIIKMIHRRKYLQALESVDSSKNYFGFIDFISREYIQSLQMILDVLIGEEIPAFEYGYNNVEERDVAILEVITKSPFSISQIMEKTPNIKRPTLKKDLARLVQDRKIKKKGAGKGTLYYR